MSINNLPSKITELMSGYDIVSVMHSHLANEYGKQQERDAMDSLFSGTKFEGQNRVFKEEVFDSVDLNPDNWTAEEFSYVLRNYNPTVNSSCEFAEIISKANKDSYSVIKNDKKCYNKSIGVRDLSDNDSMILSPDEYCFYTLTGPDGITKIVPPQAINCMDQLE